MAGGYVYWTTEPVVLTNEFIATVLLDGGASILCEKGINRPNKILDLGDKPIFTAPFITPFGNIQPMILDGSLGCSFPIVRNDLGINGILKIKTTIDVPSDKYGYWVIYEANT